MFCPDCGGEFADPSGLSCHLTRSDCNASPTPEQREIARGILLGDGNIDQDSLRVIMTNKEFLEWLDDRLGWLSNGVDVFRTPEQVREHSSDIIDDDCNFKTQYKLRTLNKFTGMRERFYRPDKQFPPDKDELTDDEIRFWYACDGTPSRGRVEIGISNYMDQREQVEEAFDRAGYNASVHNNMKVQILTDDSERFFEQTDPVPGFEHKWPGDENVSG